MDKETQERIEELNNLSDNLEKNKKRMKDLAHLIVDALLQRKNPEWENNA